MKRFLAFLIDFFIVFILFISIYKLLPTNNQIKNYNKEIKVIEEKLYKEEINNKEYLKEYTNISYKIDKENNKNLFIYFVIIFLYFIILPLIWKGYTIGLSLMKLKIIGKINFIAMFIRNIFTTGVLYIIVQMSVIYISSPTIYFVITTFLGFMHIILVIISVFMVIYRKDKRGLQDIFSRTKITKEVK